MATIKAYAIHEINRPIPGVEKVAGQPTPIETVGATRVFDATEQEMKDYERLGAARPATRSEETAEEDRIAIEGEAVTRPTLYRSVGPGSGALTEEPVASPKKADTAPKKTGGSSL